MLAGLEDATAGDIIVGEERINDVPTQARDIAMVFQSYALYPHMTVAENIAYPLRVRKVGREETLRRVERVAAMLEITELLARRPRDLSGGERQRVALARAVVRDRALYDGSPISNMDARAARELRGELKATNELGTTVYVRRSPRRGRIEHRSRDARGRLQQSTRARIYHAPSILRRGVGEPAMNLSRGY